MPGVGGTFGELLEKWYQHKAANERTAPSSLKTARIIIDRYLLRSLGQLRVEKIRTNTLDTFYAELRRRGGRCQNRPCVRPRNCGVEGHARECGRKDCIESWICPTHKGECADKVPCDESPCEHGAPLAVSSVVRVHVVVRAAFEQAIKWGWGIRRNPAEHADPGQVITEEVDPPDDFDVIRLLAEAEEEEFALATYLALAIESGARRGAMHALRWTYWERNADGTSTVRFPKVISIGPDGPVERAATRTKRSGRRVTLGPHVTAMLVRHHKATSDLAGTAGGELPEDAFVFSNDVLGEKPWRPEHTSRRFRVLKQTLNLNDESQLRHLRDLMATKLLSARMNPKVVGERGGWRKLATMLDRYAHVLPADDQAAAGIVDRMYADG